MAYCTTYYWRIDPVNDDGTTTGDVWSFTTQYPPNPPGQAANPTPANQAVDVGRNISLRWTAANATKYDVYFGTTNPPAFQTTQTGTAYSPGLLAPVTTYYWRIDSSNGCVTTPAWSGRLPPRALPEISITTATWISRTSASSSVACRGRGQRSGRMRRCRPERDGAVDGQDLDPFQTCMAGAGQTPGC